MKNLYEIGIIFRGTIICNYYFKDLPGQVKIEPHRDLRGAFISSINSFVSKTFKNNPLEYFESGNFLFAFKVSEIKAKDSPSRTKEAIIIYGIREKKRSPGKIAKEFLKKAESLLNLFIERYRNIDFLTDSYLIKDFEFELLSI